MFGAGVLLRVHGVAHIHYKPLRRSLTQYQVVLLSDMPRNVGLSVIDMQDLLGEDFLN